MDNILFRCSKCRGKLKVEVVKAGSVVTCPMCGEATSVPIPPVMPDSIAAPELDRRDERKSIVESFRHHLSNVSGPLIVVALLWGELGGLYHSASKHSLRDAFLSFVIPPYSWYRSIEFFWHDDFAGVDWPKRLRNDVKICIYFLNKASSNDVNANERTMEIENFSARIAKYPNERKEHLKEVARVYIRFMLSLMDDFQTALDTYSITGRFYFKIGEQSSKYEAALVKLGLEKEIKLSMQATDMLIKQMEEQINESKDNDFTSYGKKFGEMFSLVIMKTKGDLASCYQDLFDEKY